MKKYFLFIFLVVVLLIPNVNAAESERKKQIADLLSTYEFDFKFVDMQKNYELILESRTEEVMSTEIDGWFLRNLVRSELEKLLPFQKDDAIDMWCHRKGKEYEVYDYEQEKTVTKFFEKDECSGVVYLFEEQDSVEFVLNGNFTQVDGDEKTKKESFEIIKTIIDDVYVADVAYLNHLLYYPSNSSTAFSSELALSEFAELKKVVEENPDYNFFVGFEDTRRGDNYISMAEGSTYIEKDGIIYGFTLNTYSNANMFFVPVGTKKEDYAKVLEERLNNYVGNPEVKIKVEEYDKDKFETPYANGNVGYLFKNYLKIDIENYYKKVGTTRDLEYAKIDNKEYMDETPNIVAMYTYGLYVNDQRVEIGIAPLDVSEYSKFDTITSRDSKTGIILKTTSGNVPLDAKLLVEQFDVSEKELKHLDDLGYKNLNSYNLKLYSKILDKVISDFNNVTHVMIPLNEKWDGNLKVIYMSEDLKKVEYYDVQIVDYNNQKYLQFETKHFSNYYIVEAKEEIKSEKKEEIKEEQIIKNEDTNPQTSDNIFKYIILSILSFTILLNTIKFTKKDN